MGVPTRYKGRPWFNVRWIKINDASAPSSFQLPCSAFCQDSKERRGQSSCSNIDREIREGMSSLYLAHVLSRSGLDLVRVHVWSMRVVYVLSTSFLSCFNTQLSRGRQAFIDYFLYSLPYTQAKFHIHGAQQRKNRQIFVGRGKGFNPALRFKISKPSRPPFVQNRLVCTA